MISLWTSYFNPYLQDLNEYNKSDCPSSGIAIPSNYTSIAYILSGALSREHLSTSPSNHSHILPAWQQ